MKWEHTCNLEWLKERQKYLTASDIKHLVPMTKTGKPRKITDVDRLRIYSNKKIELTADDCVSTGAAARGHILEPYAIQAYNESRDLELPELYHWDDCILYNKLSTHLAFSPDALSFEQPSGSISIDISGKRNTYYTLGEVKCYGTERHIECCVADKHDLEERWQIATAMYVDQYISQAILIFFDPRLSEENSRLFIHTYTRHDLLDELDIIDKISSDWIHFKQTVLSFYKSGLKCNISEQDIIADLEAKSRLNP